MKRNLLVLLLLFSIKDIMAQELGTVKGKVTLKSGNSLEAVNVGLLGTPYGTATNEREIL